MSRVEIRPHGQVVATSIAAFLMCVLLSSRDAQALLEDDTTYGPLERLAPAQVLDSALLTAIGGKIEKITSADLPAFVKRQVELIAHECTSSDESAADVTLYRYTSQRTASGNFAPNYLVDLSPWLGKKLKDCHVGWPCKGRDCLLIGYIATDAASWAQSFLQLSKGWTLTPQLMADKTTSVGTFKFEVTCSEPGPQPSSPSPEDSCSSSKIWLNSGLSDFKVTEVDETDPEPDLDAPEKGAGENPPAELGRADSATVSKGAE